MSAMTTNQSLETRRESIKSLDLRRQFLAARGFERDPFKHAIAEQDFYLSESIEFDKSRAKILESDVNGKGSRNNINPIPYPSFSPLSFYVDPVYRNQDQGTLFEDLRAEGHAFIFGETGAGKTTTRMALAARTRGIADGTLVVTYRVGCDNLHFDNLDAHLDRIVRNMAIALFIQNVEQFETTAPLPDIDRNRILCQLLSIEGPLLSRAIRRILHENEPGSVWGLAEYWRHMDRPAIRRVPRSPRLIEWISQLQISPGNMMAQENWSPRDCWDFALQVVESWGFKRILLLIDGENIIEQSALWTMSCLEPLIKNISGFSKQNVSLKFFLPTEKEPSIKSYLSKIYLSKKILMVSLYWTEDGLRDLLQARFRAARAGRRTGFVDLVEPDLRDNIDQMLIEEANGSPRRLLQLIDALINQHLAHESMKETITRKDWNTVLDRFAPLIPVDQPV